MIDFETNPQLFMNKLHCKNQCLVVDFDINCTNSDWL